MQIELSLHATDHQKSKGIYFWESNHLSAPPSNEAKMIDSTVADNYLILVMALSNRSKQPPTENLAVTMFNGCRLGRCHDWRPCLHSSLYLFGNNLKVYTISLKVKI